ncbi:hypothetical protein BDN71DRAFT_1503332 [Pleurotus eryngii]|uniref:Uncharacterized protein n=1 Tax=Pleurotus eryngii TaxID=5323 RepID=A0A9P6A3B8_PLEER|nr:hypothetical protein BDN71DRAFT_1503332 [Pleurotus eryngii]
MPTPAPIFVMAFLSSVKPRSTWLATLAAKAVQEAAEAPQDIVDEEEQPVKKTHVSAAKKAMKTKKDKKTSANHDAEDKAAKAVTKKNMTLTSKILKGSRASVAPPPRSAGTGIQLPSTTPRIVSDHAHRPDPDLRDDEAPQVKADPKDDSNSSNDEEPAPVKDKGKGKAQDLHNLGAELDRDSDADADAGAGAGDEEKDDEDNDEEAAGAAEGEVAGEGDGSDGDDEGNVMIMDVDVNITPRKPASKRDASQSLLTDKHTSKAQRRTVSYSSAASSAASLPVPSCSLSPSDNLQELQGALRTTGGFACGNAFGTAPNMADFVPVDDVPPTETHGKGKVVMHTTSGMTNRAHSFPTVTESAISLFDVDGEWGVAGPFAVALEDDMDVIWDNDSRLLMLLEPIPTMSASAFPAFPPLILSHSGGSVAPSSTICIHLISYSTKQHLTPHALLLEVPLSLIPNTKPNDGDIILAYEHWKAASTARERLKAKYDAHDPKSPPLPSFPNVENCRAIYMNPSSFSNYNPLFLAAIQHPDILAYLEGDAGLGSAIYKKLWGSVKPGKATLGQLVERINTDQKKEEKRATKKKAGLPKSNLFYNPTAAFHRTTPESNDTTSGTPSSLTDSSENLLPTSSPSPIPPPMMATTMPVRGHHTAPKFNGKPEGLHRFFSEVEYLAARAQIEGRDLIRATIRYLNDSDWEIWRSSGDAADGDDWEAFKTCIGKLYPGSDNERRWCPSDLSTITALQSQTLMLTKDDLGVYHRKFLVPANWLLSKNSVSTQDVRRDYLAGFDPSTRQKIKDRLAMVHMQHHPDDPYTITEIYTEANFILGTSTPATLTTSSTSPTVSPTTPAPVKTESADIRALQAMMQQFMTIQQSHPQYPPPPPQYLYNPNSFYPYPPPQTAQAYAYQPIPPQQNYQYLSQPPQPS